MSAKEITLYDPNQTSLDVLDLETLAAMANEENRLVEASVEAALSDLSDGLRHAMRCGEILVALQAKVNSPRWAQWVAENLTFKPKTAVNYVRIYTYRDQIPSPHMTMGAALAHLRGLPATGLRLGAPRRHPIEVEQEAIRLRSEGLSLDSIADALDVGRATIDYWTNPKTRERTQKRARRYRQEAAEARRAKRRAESVAAAGGSIQKSYDLVRKLTRELDAALGNSTDTEMRNALRASYSAATRCEAEILRALKIQ